MLFLPVPVLGAEGSVGFSQVKTRGSAAGDEFIELFNPGSAPVELSGYKLIKETASGTTYTVLSFGNVQILPQSFLLLALESSSFSGEADIIYKTALADNNTLKLFDASQSVVDQLAWGEAQTLANHDAAASYQRAWQQASGTWSPWTIQMFSNTHSSGDLLMVVPEVDESPESIVLLEPDIEPVPTESTAPLANISISEVQLLVPTGDVAWVELSSTSSGALDGWKLMMDGVVLVDLYGSIVANGYQVIPLPVSAPQTGSLSLHNPVGAVVQSISMPLGDTKTRSFAISSASTWSWTDVVTAGRPNVLRLQDPLPACVPTTQPTTPTSVENPITPVSTAPTTGQISINEVFANPSGDENTDEFVELANADAFEVSLLGWIIADASKQTALPDLRVPANGFLILRKTQSGLTLNNTNETLRLINASGQTMTSIAYEAAAEDVSWNAGNPWFEATPTPGAPNMPAPVVVPDEIEEVVADQPVTVNQPSTVFPEIIIDDVEPVLLSTAPSDTKAKSTASTTKSAAATSKAAQQTTFAAWSKVKANTRVQVVGVVSVPPGVFGDKVVTIQDVTGSFAGIELYFSAAAWPELEMGDIVEVVGKKSSAKLGDRLLVSSADDIITLDHINLDPVVLPIGDLGANHHRLLVAIDSRVVDESRGLLDLSDDTGELRASLNKADVVWEQTELPVAGFLAGIYVHAPKPELWIREADDISIEKQDVVEPTAHRKQSQTTQTSIEPTTITASTNSTPDSPWLAPLAAAGSAGGLGWYFFQDQLRQHGGKLIERLRK